MLQLGILLTVFLGLVYEGNGLMRIDPLVETKVGLIRGLRATDGDYAMFMGIPYATVDEENIFGASKPHPGFGDEVFEAFDDTAWCPQVEEFNSTIVGTLDCLHVNVYVPNSATSRNKLPVLVWIHGGGFSIGASGRYIHGPRYLVRHDIILVTLNYRVGPYGFMCLDTPEVPGNQGLKDQQLALNWIKDNIEAFGGDANKITLYGESAGASSVGVHDIYGDHNLFDKLIMHSGSGLVPWMIEPNDVNAPLKLAERLGYTASDIDEAIEFLSQTDPKLIIASTQALGLTFWPCVEKEFEGVERLIHDYPININRPHTTSKSVMLGYNRDERMDMYGTLPAEQFPTLNTFYNDLSNYFNFDSEYLAEMEELVRHFYIGDEPFDISVKEELAKYASDFIFIYPAYRTIQKYLNSGTNNIYLFVFSYNGGRNFNKNRMNVTHDGVVHADEVGYIFDPVYMSEPSPEDQLAIDRITTLWANFVKYGNPTPDVTDILPVTWPPVTEDTLPYLELTSDVTVGKRHYHERIAFWDLFYKLNVKYQLGYKMDDN